MSASVGPSTIDRKTRDQDMAVSSLMVPLGTPAHDFELPSVDGATVKLADLDGRALVVMFLCNHCPYVRHVERALGAAVAEYAGRDVAAVGICSNDTEAHPDDGPAGRAGAAGGICNNDPEAPPHDGPAGLAEQARRAGFEFPYLIDDSQQVAAAYRGMCTPDPFVYDAPRRPPRRGACS